jgi:hypothetical protein
MSFASRTPPGPGTRRPASATDHPPEVGAPIFAGVLLATAVATLGAPFGWPKGVDYAEIFTWSLGNQLWCMLGGFLIAFAVLSLQRRSRGAGQPLSPS